MSISTKDIRAPGALSDIGIGRVAAVAALMIVAFALQSTLLTRATILGVVPQVLLVVVVSLAYTDGERVGLVVGFFGGLLQDLLIPESIIGLYALVYTLIGFGVGSFRKYAVGDSVWTPVLVVAAASAAAEMSYATLAIIMGQQWVSLTFTAKVAGLVVLYNTLLTPFIFPAVRRVAERFRPERIYRW
ncbi:MAG: rod shape-determining protein MreD [Actinomycetota bacterium]